VSDIETEASHRGDGRLGDDPLADDPSRSAPDRPPFVERHRRGLFVTLSVLAVLLVAVFVSALIPLPYYAYTPGDALNVSGLVSVPAANAHQHRGSILLTDVQIVPLRAVDWLFYRLNSDDQIYPKGEVSGTLTNSQYNEQGVIEMATARQAATVVGLRAVGYNANAVPDGVVVFQPAPNSPASSVLAIGDVLTAIDGLPTPSLASLSNVFGTKRPGQTALVTYHFLGSSTTHSVTVALGALRAASGTTPESCVRASAASAASGGHAITCLPIGIEQIYKTTGAPFAVSIDAAGIIGPSAGLAYTLGLIAKLDPADLTGGQRIAATGTMSIDGSVGDVGGVAQKTVAVRDAGATVFFVPPPELKVARAHAGNAMKVFAVATLSQALSDLEHLGGHLDHAASSPRS
jgi:PDZ domain-containing protein